MGKSWSNRSAEAMLLALRAQGLLEKDLTCIASIAHQVALDAAESEQGPLIVGALARVLPRSHRERPDNFFWNYHSYELANDRDLFRKVRLAVYANADNEFTRLRQIFDREKREDGQAILASHLAKLPADIAWIERRTLLIRDALLTGMVNALLENGIVRADIAAAIAHFTQSGVAPSPALNKALVWCDILAEKFETARERIAALPPEDSVAGTALGATIHFLTGRNSDAVASFREALKQLRKHTGRRKAVLPGAAGIFHVLSLLREHDTRLHGEIRNLLEAARGQLPWTGYQALCALFEVACGQDV